MCVSGSSYCMIVDERDINFGNLPSSVKEANVSQLNLAQNVQEFARRWKTTFTA